VGVNALTGFTIALHNYKLRTSKCMRNKSRQQTVNENILYFSFQSPPNKKHVSLLNHSSKFFSTNIVVATSSEQFITQEFVREQMYAVT